MTPRKRPVTTLVVMGVSGVGKSTVMAMLAERLGWATLEGDALHPPANVAKMAAGEPLTDADRAPWLAEIAAWIGDREADGVSSIVTCSALRRTYREALRAGHPSVWFVHLVAPASTVALRMTDRAGHFMPPALLESQLDALEPLGPDEPGWAVDATPEPTVIIDEIVAKLGLDPG